MCSNKQSLEIIQWEKNKDYESQSRVPKEN